MSKITLVTGGQRSGKSSFSEKIFKDTNDVLYIATAIRTDEEMEERIKKHRKDRNPNWDTYEGYKNLDEVINKTEHENILLDCVTNMVNNLMFSKNMDFENLKQNEINDFFSEIKAEFIKLMDSVRKNDKNLVLVSNEVGLGLISSYKLGRIFQDYAGFINQYLAKGSDEVYFMVSSIPMKIK